MRKLMDPQAIIPMVERWYSIDRTRCVAPFTTSSPAARIPMPRVMTSSPSARLAFIARGKGCHIWDIDGNEFIEYGMGLRAVTLGHAYAPVVEAAYKQMLLGNNFNRPSLLEFECVAVVAGTGAGRRDGEVRQGRLIGPHGRAEAGPRLHRTRPGGDLYRQPVLLL